jgi:hypothetical protein
VQPVPQVPPAPHVHRSVAGLPVPSSVGGTSGHAASGLNRGTASNDGIGSGGTLLVDASFPIGRVVATGRVGAGPPERATASSKRSEAPRPPRAPFAIERRCTGAGRALRDLVAPPGATPQGLGGAGGAELPAADDLGAEGAHPSEAANPQRDRFLKGSRYLKDRSKGGNVWSRVNRWSLHANSGVLREQARPHQREARPHQRAGGGVRATSSAWTSPRRRGGRDLISVKTPCLPRRSVPVLWIRVRGADRIVKYPVRRRNYGGRDLISADH